MKDQGKAIRKAMGILPASVLDELSAEELESYVSVEAPKIIDKIKTDLPNMSRFDVEQAIDALMLVRTRLWEYQILKGSLNGEIKVLDSLKSVLHEKLDSLPTTADSTLKKKDVPWKKRLALLKIEDDLERARQRGKQQLEALEVASKNDNMEKLFNALKNEGLAIENTTFTKPPYMWTGRNRDQLYQVWTTTSREFISLKMFSEYFIDSNGKLFYDHLNKKAKGRLDNGDSARLDDSLINRIKAEIE